MDATPTRNRPWYRLHLSTYFVLLVPLGVLVLVGVPGYFVGVDYWPQPGVQYLWSEHGWPLVHLDRLIVDIRPQSGFLFLGSRNRGPDFPPSLRWATSDRGRCPTSHRGSGWRDTASWKQTGTIVVLHKAALAINLLVAVAICAAVAEAL